jgi:hypothetical protein
MVFRPFTARALFTETLDSHASILGIRACVFLWREKAMKAQSAVLCATNRFSGVKLFISSFIIVLLPDDEKALD